MRQPGLLQLFFVSTPRPKLYHDMEPIDYGLDTSQQKDTSIPVPAQSVPKEKFVDVASSHPFAGLSRPSPPPQETPEGVPSVPLMNLPDDSQPITTEVIQQYLEENQILIQAVVENQNAGNLDLCAKYQKKLVDNLIFLASVTDQQELQQQPPNDTPVE